MKLKPTPAPAAPLADWPRPLLPPFIATAELVQLKQELTRYLSSEIPGRSFLIAGHRGTGKTSLVRRAVDELADDLLVQSTREEFYGVPSAGRRLPNGPFQRPILVKLHGPTMLKSDVIVTKPAEPGSNGETTTTVEAGPHSALLQITVALYRALVTEINTGYAAHAARAARYDNRPDRREMAAQLAIELDRGTDPALLRQAWSSIGRLDNGVLWPETADDTLKAHDMSGQGLRELAALATAGKAYLKCTGKVTEAQKRNNSLTRDADAGIKASADSTHMVGLLSSLGLGVAAGATVQETGHSAPASFGIGILTWLLGTLTLDWSARRTSKADSSYAQSFDADVSLPTLERDLPQIITRMRQAGLAPVFAVDELDKLSDSENQTALLIKQLKHIVTDLGFFCFLVDRDYFERIEQRLRLHPYGVEHTFFSDRILIRPDPGGIIAYLVERLDPQGDATTGPTATAIAALELMYEARLNLTTLMRGLARLNASEDAATIANSQRRRVLAAIQMAANLALRQSDVQARAAIDPTFAQLAIDTAYYVAFELEAGKLTVDASEDGLRLCLNEHLVARQPAPNLPPAMAAKPAPPAQAGAENGAGGDPAAGAGPLPDAAAAASSPGAVTPEDGGDDARVSAAPVNGGAETPSVSDRELKLLHGMLRQMLSHLESFASLAAMLGSETLHPGFPVQLSTLLPTQKTSLCSRAGDKFIFNVDQFGGDIADSIYLDANDLEDVHEQLAYFSALKLTLDQAAISLDDLAQTPLLQTLTAATLVGAASAIEAADRSRLRSAEFNDARALLDRAFAEIGRNAAGIGWLSVIVSNLIRVIDGKLPLESRDLLARIAALIDYTRPPNEWLSKTPSFASYPLPREADQLDLWAVRTESSLLDTAASGEMLGWSGLYPQLRNYFFRVRRKPWLDIGFPDLVAAAFGRAPQCHLNAKLACMRIADWSALARICIPKDSGPAPDGPYWMLMASLRALGFGRAALARLADPFMDPALRAEFWRLDDPPALPGDQAAPSVPASPLASAAALIDGAPDRPGGLLIDDGMPEVAASLPSTARGILVAPANFWQDRNKALQRLIDSGLFDD